VESSDSLGLSFSPSCSTADRPGRSLSGGVVLDHLRIFGFLRPFDLDPNLSVYEVTWPERDRGPRRFRENGLAKMLPEAFCPWGLRKLRTGERRKKSPGPSRALETPQELFSIESNVRGVILFQRGRSGGGSLSSAPVAFGPKLQPRSGLLA
jgi:hypothetical protein